MVFFLLHYLMMMGAVCEGKSPETGLPQKTTSDELSQENSGSLEVFRSKIEASAPSYGSSVSKLVSFYEARGGRMLYPKLLPKIGIKLETSCAPGIQVSPALVDALLLFLEERGYLKEQVFIVGNDPFELKVAGFSSGGGIPLFYKGYRLYTSEDETYYNPNWFHESPLPPTPNDRARFFLRYPRNLKKRVEEERKSYLPARLFLGDVYWINLAVAMDSLHMGIDGAVANLSLGAVDNSRRFINKPTLAPAAAVEILAIPELWQKRIFSIIDLSRFQFAGGGNFDAEFLGYEPSLLLGENPFCVDYLALQSLNVARANGGFSTRKFEDVLMFRYAEELGLGKVRDCKLFDLP